MAQYLCKFNTGLRLVIITIYASFGKVKNFLQLRDNLHSAEPLREFKSFLQFCALKIDGKVRIIGGVRR
jgi:hypothetical protein